MNIKKTIFIHIPRTGGCFANSYLKNNIFKELLVFDSWKENKNRDWNGKELLNFMDYEKCYIHNHTWEKDVFLKFKEKKWFSFFFIRNPKDIICSRYFRDKENGLYSDLSLEEFLNSKENLESLFPSFWKEVSYIDEFSEKNFSIFIKKVFKKKYISHKAINCSGNKGYDFYFKEEKKIKKKTDQLIESSYFFQQYLEIKSYIKKNKNKLN